VFFVVQYVDLLDRIIRNKKMLFFSICISDYIHPSTNSE